MFPLCSLGVVEGHRAPRRGHPSGSSRARGRESLGQHPPPACVTKVSPVFRSHFQNIRTHEYQVKQHNYIVKHFVSSEYGKRVYFAVKVVVTEWLWKRRMLIWWLFGD
jgi:hypothetical protein